MSPAEDIPAVTEETTIWMQYFLQSFCMQGIHVVVSYSSLTGRSGGGCSCTSQGRCRSRLSLTEVSASLCRFYSKTISHSPNTISNQHWQVSPATVPPRNTNPAVSTQDQSRDSSALPVKPVGGTELEEPPSWKSPPLLERDSNGCLFLFSPASSFSCSALVNFVHYL